MTDPDTHDEAEGREPELDTLPLDAWHRARGARMVGFAGYHMPIQYDGIMAEHLWTREHAGLFDVSHMGQLDLSGAGVAAAIEALMPIDLATLNPGRQRYSLLLAEDGGVLDDLMLIDAGGRYRIVVNGATKWDDIAFLREHLPDEVTLTYLDEAALLALQGPSAASVLAGLGLEPVDAATPAPADMGFMHAGDFRWNGALLTVSRSGYTGEDGYEISLPASHATALADALAAHPEVRPIGLGARDSLRLEAGLPLYGHDLDAGTDPVEADLAFAINKRRRAEGGFNGAARILAGLADGPARRRVGFTVEGRQPVREGAAILSDDRRVGTITSGGFAPSLGAPIAMGYVEAAHVADDGLVAEVRGKRIALTPAPMPFVPHRYVRKGA